MQKGVILTAVVLLALGFGSAIKALTPLASITQPPAVTMSIEDIHRQVDTKSLPVLEVREPFELTGDNRFRT
jgi:hypothetical protein